MATEPELETPTSTNGASPVKPDAVSDAAPAAAPEGGAANAGSDVQGPWGDDWRQKIAGDDEKALKRLSRFQSPNDLFKSYRALEQKLSTGEVKAALPENATEEQVAEWRKGAGIPEEPTGYLENLPDGLIVGEADKPIVDAFLKDMHGKNAPPEAVHGALAWYYREIEERQAALADEDKRIAQATEDELRGEWGGEFRSNSNAIEMMLDAAPGGLGDLLRGARLGDGSPLMGNADAKRWLAHLANELNPTGTIVPGGTENQIESLQARKLELENLMRTDRKAYNARRPEYMKIVETLDKLKARAA